MGIDPAVLERGLADAQSARRIYLRIDDPDFFGESEYRPSEGWIDLEMVYFDLPERPHDVRVVMSHNRTVAPLLEAVKSGRHLATVVIRYSPYQTTLDDAMVVKFQSGGDSDDGRPTTIFTFDSKQITTALILSRPR